MQEVRKKQQIPKCDVRGPKINQVEFANLNPAHMEMFYRNRHCKHIIFGGSDNGYAGFLEQFAIVDSVNERITLLREAHVPFWLARTMEQFRSARLQEVFRPSKLPTIPSNGTPITGTKRPLADPIPPPPRRPSPPEYNPARPLIPGVNGAAQVRPAPSPVTDPNDTHHSVYVNRYGQRLDVPVEYDRDYLQVLFERKSRLCNNFYLKSHCPFGNSCQWDHSAHLNQRQLDTLRHKARTSACRNPFCRDPECSLGHMCPRGNSCNVGQCKFLPEMHRMDTSEVYLLNTATDARTLVRSQD